MKGIVAVLAAVVAWLGLMMMAAVMVLVTYASVIMLLMAVFGVLCTAAVAIVLAATTARRRVVAPPRSCLPQAYWTSPVNRHHVRHPVPPRARAAAPAQRPLVQRRAPSTFVGLAGGHR